MVAENIAVVLPSLSYPHIHTFELMGVNPSLKRGLWSIYNYLSMISINVEKPPATSLTG